MATPHFGEKVTGLAEYQRAVAESDAGADVFGTRVRSALSHETVPEDVAKANSQFGPRTVIGAHQSNRAGEPTEASVEEIAKILDVHTGNTTFLDSLYEAELGRPGGPRRDAIQVMYEIERSHKGQMRPGIMAQMQRIMGVEQVTAQAEAAAAGRMMELEERNRQLEEENRLLRDADRAKALKERQDNLQAAEDTAKQREKGKTVNEQAGGTTGEMGEVPSLADLTRDAAGTTGGKQQSRTSAGSGQKVNTSQEGTTGGETGASSASTTPPAEEEEEEEEEQPDAKVDTMTRAELLAEAQRLGVRIDDGKGELSDGSYSVEQLRRKVKRAVKKEASTSQEG